MCGSCLSLVKMDSACNGVLKCVNLAGHVFDVEVSGFHVGLMAKDGVGSSTCVWWIDLADGRSFPCQLYPVFAPIEGGMPMLYVNFVDGHPSDLPSSLYVGTLGVQSKCPSGDVLSGVVRLPVCECEDVDATVDDGVVKLSAGAEAPVAKLPHGYKYASMSPVGQNGDDADVVYLGSDGVERSMPLYAQEIVDSDLSPNYFAVDLQRVAKVVYPVVGPPRTVHFLYCNARSDPRFPSESEWPVEVVMETTSGDEVRVVLVDEADVPEAVTGLSKVTKESVVLDKSDVLSGYGFTDSVGDSNLFHLSGSVPVYSADVSDGSLNLNTHIGEEFDRLLEYEASIAAAKSKFAASMGNK